VRVTQQLLVYYQLLQNLVTSTMRLALNTHRLKVKQKYLKAIKMQQLSVRRLASMERAAFSGSSGTNSGKPNKKHTRLTLKNKIQMWTHQPHLRTRLVAEARQYSPILKLWSAIQLMRWENGCYEQQLLGRRRRRYRYTDSKH
jgi:hypothetical protein